MDKYASAGLGFLLAVLWFDLMFDTQTRGYTGELPAEVLASISAYYRRVTTEAFPMNRLVSSVMILIVAAIAVQIWRGEKSRWVGWTCLALMAFGVFFTLTRTVPNAVQLGSGADTLAVQSDLARAIYHDHVMSFGRTLLVLGLQLFAE
jgi:hypothetical protein